MIGHTISHYKILEKLGQGGMGEVFLAEDTKLRRKVALKFLPQEFTLDKDAVERFQREAQAAAALNHPNIVTIYEINQHENQIYIAMEYVDGRPLKEIVNGVASTHHPSDSLHKKGRHKGLSLPLNEVINIFTQICEGLLQAHEVGIVHRDIKPHNILIDKDGRVKILDFGLAKLKGAGQLTKETSTIGTVHYMSPEQTIGKQVDQRTDIWSLGVILYEILCGQTPFKGDYEQAIIYSILNEKPDPITTVRSDIPCELERIINKALEKNPSERYQQINELLVDMRQLIDNVRLKKIVSKQKGSGYKPERLKKRLVTIFIPIIIVVLVGGFFLFKALLKKDTSLISAGLTTEKKHTIAILPFADMSPQKDQEYFCDGIAEELINALTKVSGFQVTARTSAFSFKGKNLDIPTIGKKLKVEMVLEGSVRKEGDNLRIIAQLVKVSDGYHLWSEAYNRKLKDVFAIQEDISRSIVDKLKINLLTGEQNKLEKRNTSNVEAYNLYLKGRYFWGKRTEEGLKKSLEYFQSAIDKDPQYASAYVGKADAYTILTYWGFLTPKQAFPKAKALAKKALQIDDSLAEAHTTLAWICLDYDWDWAEAEKRFKIAIKLNPNYAIVYHWYGAYLLSMGQLEESLKMRKQALKLDPFFLLINAELASALINLGRFDEAKEQLQKTLEMDPDFSPTHLNWGHFYSELGQYQEAIKAYQKALSIPWAAGFLGYAYAKVGKKEKAKKILAELIEKSKKRYIRPIAISQIYFGLGDMDKAFDWLEKGFEERDPAMPWIRSIVPEENNLHSHPRYKNLLKKMRFPE